MRTKKKIGAWIHGSSGRMGHEIQKALVETPTNFRLIGGSGHRFEGELFHQGQRVTKDLLAQSLAKDGVELILDFSGVEANELLLQTLAAGNLTGKAVLLGTTGLDADLLLRWRSLAEANSLRLLIAPNTSIGILLLVRSALVTAGIASKLGFDIEIVETHHRYKKDAPSGTAKFIARTLVDGIEGLRLAPLRTGARQAGEIGVHSVRGGAVFGEHEVRIIGDSEEINISHRAFSRELFAKGALVLSDWLVCQSPGVYGLLDIDINDLARDQAATED